MVEPGTHRSPNEHGVYETHAEWAKRTSREAAERKAQAGLEARFAALEKRVDKRLGEITEALVLSFGDLRTELDERIAKERAVYDEERERMSLTVAQRSQLVRQGREIEQLRTEVEKLRQELADERGKGKGLRTAK